MDLTRLWVANQLHCDSAPAAYCQRHALTVALNRAWRMERSGALDLVPATPEYDNGRMFVAEGGVRHNVHAFSVWPMGERVLSLSVLPFLMLAAEG